MSDCSHRFPLGQTRQQESTSGRRGSDPWSPEHIYKLTQPYTGLSERNKTGEWQCWRGVTAPDQMVCVGVCTCVNFLRQWSLTGMAVSQAEVWWELGWGMKGWRIEGWRQAVGDKGITKSWQLLFCFFSLTEFIPMAAWGENVYFSWLLLTFCCISGIFLTCLYSGKINWAQVLYNT